VTSRAASFAVDREPRFAKRNDRGWRAHEQFGGGVTRDGEVVGRPRPVHSVCGAMADAIDLAKLHGPEQIEQALASCPSAGRFADGDLVAILGDQQRQAVVVPLPLSASEASSLHARRLSRGT
jgi:hypothetical protein